ncbi:hypothetical protein LEP1GSC048_0641 [Leptospira santarosai serovar Shermani str. 1342KT]|nr:hypothetical protein LEP1GSC048_0641 [Leptospira santarosai serovar Shermani str. 1342KT]
MSAHSVRVTLRRSSAVLQILRQTLGALPSLSVWSVRKNGSSQDRYFELIFFCRLQIQYSQFLMYLNPYPVLYFLSFVFVFPLFHPMSAVGVPTISAFGCLHGLNPFLRPTFVVGVPTISAFGCSRGLNSFLRPTFVVGVPTDFVSWGCSRGLNSFLRPTFVVGVPTDFVSWGCSRGLNPFLHPTFAVGIPTISVFELSS